jgi:hypothetical protein
MESVNREPGDNYVTLIREAVMQDAEAFHALGNQVHNADNSDWDAVVVDGAGGHFVGEYIHPIISMLAAKRDKQTPVMLEVANSGGIYKSPEAKDHDQTVGQYLAEQIAIHGIQRALIATEHVHYGIGVTRIAHHLARHAIGVDVAILALYRPHIGLITLRHDPAVDQILFDHRLAPFTHMLTTPLLVEATGVRGVAGYPTPQPNPDSRASVVSFAHNAYRELAQDYIDNHSLRS